MRQVILASTSPRRKELLTKMGVNFTVVPSNFIEHLDDTKSPESVAKELSRGKAMAVAQQHPEAIVIGSDLIVAVSDRQLGKAADLADAWTMYRLTTSQPNDIYSAFTVICLEVEVELSHVEYAKIILKPFDKTAIETYLQTGDYADKAAAYGVQHPAGVPLVDHIEGDFDAVLGLPTHTLATFLQQLGVTAHPANVLLPQGLIVK